MNDLDLLRKHILESETFCFYPYLELSTNPAGHVKPCCYYRNTLSDNGSRINIISGSSLESAWNSKDIKNVRKMLYEGVQDQNCKVCYRDQEASMRVRSIKEYKNNINVLQLVKNTIDNNFSATHLPTRLELKPNNLCNLKCVICNSYDSSQIAKELKELSEKYKGIEIYNGRFIKISQTPGITEGNQAFHGIDEPDWSENPQVWESFKTIVPGLEVLSFAGGEPTIMPFVSRALQYCVDTGHSKHIKVFVASNFTNLNKQFLDLMPHFEKFELIASIDGTEKVQEYARFPSKWSQISKNYLLAKEYMKHKNVKILINITVSILNVANLTDLLYWIEDRANEYPYYSEWPYNINLLMGPADHQINHLPNEIKDLCKSRLTKYLSESRILKEFHGLDSKIHLLLRELDAPANLDLIKEFKTRIAVLDEHRKIKLTNYIPDLARIFNE